MMEGRNRWYEILGSISQFLNAVLNGNRDQTYSARSYEAYYLTQKGVKKSYWPTVSVSVLDWVFRIIAGEKQHCKDAFLYDSEFTYQSREFYEQEFDRKWENK